MYDIRQFRPTLYFLLMLGITGFCYAAAAPGLWLLAMGAIGLHWLFRSRGIRTTLPGWAAALAAVLFGLLTFNRFMFDTGTQLLTAGQFLVLLQLVKLFQEGTPDHRAENRNFGWLLILSLLLMVAAAINTASLLFGLMFLSYLFLSLYCCLLFHLKVETENAKAAMTIPKDAISPAQLRQTERSLPKSMRRLTAAVSVAGLTLAVVVFIFFPRGPGQGIFGQLNFRPAQALTGFSEQVSFESVARITQSQELVARVEQTIDGELVHGTRPPYLRGVTLDAYTGDGKGSIATTDGRPGAAWLWAHSRRDEQPISQSVSSNEPSEFAEPGTARVETNVKLEPTGSTTLFIPAGAYSITLARDAGVNFYPSDETIKTREPVNGKFEYTVRSRDAVGFRPRALSDQRQVAKIHPAAPSRIDPRIAEYARRPEVSGTDADGKPLWEKRGLAYIANPLDEQIAANIERHLLTQFSYTLDLTDTARRHDQNPIVQFLEETRRGHCEYFASAMVLMCQSLGIESRMVVGFKSDEFNPMIGRYIVRQSHAHAWVEVRVANGENWRTYDPTTGREYKPVQPTGLLSRTKRFFDFLEYTWADSVVAYDRDRRENLLSSVDRALTSSASRTQAGFSRWDNFLPDPRTWYISPVLVGAVMIGIGAVGVCAFAYFAWERWRLRRRAFRIGLGDLPDQEKIRLARQLGFYDELLRMLSLRGIDRPKHKTPLEFTHALTHLPAEAYDTVHRLTRIYYRIRYGRAELAPDYHRRIRETLVKLEPSLGPPKLP